VNSNTQPLLEFLSAAKKL